MNQTFPAPEQVLRAALAYNGADVMRNHHLLKVTGFADAIAQAETEDETLRYIIKIAAILHDIGIHEAERKYGSSAGHLQEQEGPAVARALLAPLGMPEHITDRVCWLIAHHHTLNPVDGLDHRILLEADFLVNVYEDGLSRRAVQTFCETVAATPTGLRMIRDLYPENSPLFGEKGRE